MMSSSKLKSFYFPLLMSTWVVLELQGSFFFFKLSRNNYFLTRSDYVLINSKVQYTLMVTVCTLTSTSYKASGEGNIKSAMRSTDSWSACCFASNRVTCCVTCVSRHVKHRDHIRKQLLLWKLVQHLSACADHFRLSKSSRNVSWCYCKNLKSFYFHLLMSTWVVLEVHGSFFFKMSRNK